MTPFAESIFLTQIANHIKGARRALDRLKLAAKEGNGEAVYDDAANLLAHAAIISKILNPTSNKARPHSSLRGKYLRSVLNIDSEVALDRRLRNHLEHIDERLEDWLGQNKSGVYINMGLLPISFLGVAEPNIRFLDLASGIYNFLDEQFDISAIMVSLDKIFKPQRRGTNCSMYQNMVETHFSCEKPSHLWPGPPLPTMNLRARNRVRGALGRR
jgi:hypothetical protein